jgi:DNA-binding CsgD family transcriptional regulator
MMKMKNLISSREIQILRLIADEHSTNEIAEKLFISAHTVISHRRQLLRKLRAKNTAGLIRRAFEIQILESPFTI